MSVSVRLSPGDGGTCVTAGGEHWITAWGKGRSLDSLLGFSLFFRRGAKKGVMIQISLCDFTLALSFRNWLIWHEPWPFDLSESKWLMMTNGVSVLLKTTCDWPNFTSSCFLPLPHLLHLPPNPPQGHRGLEPIPPVIRSKWGVVEQSISGPHTETNNHSHQHGQFWVNLNKSCIFCWTVGENYKNSKRLLPPCGLPLLYLQIINKYNII